MSSGHCRMHRGASTDARAPEGLARSTKAHSKHALYCAEARAERRLLQQLLKAIVICSANSL